VSALRELWARLNSQAGWLFLEGPASARRTSSHSLRLVPLACEEEGMAWLMMKGWPNEFGKC
jgi:hypothetical protein